MNIRSLIYGVHSYAELSMKLSLAGYQVASRDVFDMCHPDDWKWEVFIAAYEECVDENMSTAEIDKLVLSMLGLDEFDEYIRNLGKRECLTV